MRELPCTPGNHLRGELIPTPSSWSAYANPKVNLNMVRQEVGGSHLQWQAGGWGGESLFGQVDPAILKSPHVLGRRDLCREKLWVNCQRQGVERS